MCVSNDENCPTCLADEGLPVSQENFRAPFTPSEGTIRRVNEVFDFIEENPQMWDQDDYGNDYSETNCFMGLVIRRYHDGSNRFPYGGFNAMDLLEMGLEHSDRCDFIAMFITNSQNGYEHPTLDEMRDRVSVALNHDFRKKVNDGQDG